MSALLDPIFEEYVRQRRMLLNDEERVALRHSFFVGAHTANGLFMRAMNLSDYKMVMVIKQLRQECEAVVKESFKADAQLNNHIEKIT